MNYNLLEEKWIPILWKEGKTGRVGVITALEQASEIRCITLASPLDLFAMHRFVLTLLYWKASLAKGVEHVRDTLLESRKIPCKVLNGIKKEGYCFDLFNNNAPFLQDPSIRNINITEKDKKSAGSFFAECATGTNIAHFHHGDDDNMRLCLPCAALGMLRVVPWSQAGGAGLTPSVHNAPPIMAIAIGDNLAKTLGLNLVPLDVQAGKATWSGQFKPTNSIAPIPYLEALTWNPRRILLPSPQKGTCWYCGQADVPTVGKIVYMKNKNTKKQSKVKLFEWQDPAAFYVEDFKTIKSTKEKHAEEGRDLLLVKNDSIRKSTVILKNADHNRWLLVVPCTNPANNKTFDHRQLELKDFSSKTIQSILPSVQPPSQGLDGWKQPKQSYPSGNKQFVLLAARLLTNADWGTLSN
ncbi:MAG: type I-E CRISPR-associated protein Cse1/CasA, partial [candidate division Zixibacteria bacterium]|nr:type I-E CRISPR-associated protein Cse1/CasA [candidate division Zixibacteria bacterium]